MPLPLFREFEERRQTHRLLARQIHYDAIMLVAHVARVAGLRLPDERVVLARFTFLGVGILEVELGQLVATLIERLVCESARLLERQRGSRRVLVEIVPVPEYPAGRGIDGDAVLF